ncbi:MAG: pitrilysin family protein [Phycisphaerales bacterium]|jgi:zinc protease|nr:pitrilysin family protein [Phycisphaerales bacterium]
MLTTLITAVLGFITPGHPSEITFPEYSFTPPMSEDYLEVLSCGVPVYVAEDKELPLINVSFTFLGGKYLEPNNLVGLTGVMASMVQSGGTTSVSAEDVDERFAYLAANTSVVGSATVVSASLNSLSSNFDESFGLFLDVLQNPGFDESRLRIEVDSIVEGLKQRNDYPSGILSRESRSLLYGDSYLGREPVFDSINSINKGLMLDLYSRIINPSNMVVSISGDFKKEDMLKKLDDSICSWKMGSETENPPDVISNYSPGIYFVDQDVPQGGVRIGLRSLRRSDPDLEAAIIMNYILGGGGFSSRITQSVRSNEGLAYGAGSRLSPGTWSDGLWGAHFESKNSTVALAAKLVFDEIKKIKTELVSDEELELAKGSLVEQFPSTFQSKIGMLKLFVMDNLTNRDPSYWQTFRDKISAVTAEDVQRVANRLLRTEDMLVVVVGNWEEIKQGDSGGRANMDDIKNIIGGEVVELPLRDPLTLRATSK